jgi:hypothetical protein
MQEFPINWFAILAAVIIKQAIGAFWYSPALFGPSWCKLAGVSEAEMKAGLVKALIPDVIGSALMAFVLVHAVHYAGANGWGKARPSASSIGLALSRWQRSGRSRSRNGRCSFI